MSSTMTAASSSFLLKATRPPMARFRPFSLPMCFWARSLLSQKSGAPIWASIASISRCFCSTSKKPPQVASALLDVLEVREGFGCDHRATIAANRSLRRKGFFPLQLRRHAEVDHAALLDLVPGVVRRFLVQRKGLVVGEAALAAVENHQADAAIHRHAHRNESVHAVARIRLQQQLRAHFRVSLLERSRYL